MQALPAVKEVEVAMGDTSFAPVSCQPASFSTKSVRLLRMNFDASFWRAALVGYERKLVEIENTISDLQQRINASGTGAGPAPTRKRTLSAAARKRIAAAQRKRWAAYKKRKAGNK